MTSCNGQCCFHRVAPFSIAAQGGALNVLRKNIECGMVRPQIKTAHAHLKREHERRDKAVSYVPFVGMIQIR